MSKLLSERFMKRATPDDIKEQLDKGADVNERDRAGYSPLHVGAYRNQNIAVIETLTQAGADVNARDNKGWSPLHVGGSI
ncbi:MAG: ankyrin repeat domain-containing protein [Alphaproteobacteria bacterium GM202ARS2]|nr:ankyrin repeat domain-containing protein [Alphaproteobacteria bacterium GM202ARS2]